VKGEESISLGTTHTEIVLVARLEGNNTKAKVGKISWGLEGTSAKKIPLKVRSKDKDYSTHDTPYAMPGPPPPPPPPWTGWDWLLKVILPLMILGVILFFVGRGWWYKNGPARFPPESYCKWETAEGVGDTADLARKKAFALGKEAKDTHYLPELPLGIIAKAVRKPDERIGLMVEWGPEESGVSCFREDEMGDKKPFISGDSGFDKDILIFEIDGTRELKLAFHGDFDTDSGAFDEDGDDLGDMGDLGGDEFSDMDSPGDDEFSDMDSPGDDEFEGDELDE
ncbi:MAG: hypothetical protein VCC04_12615, partial [Myxococcota bacterium]